MNANCTVWGAEAKVVIHRRGREPWGLRVKPEVSLVLDGEERRAHIQLDVNDRGALSEALFFSEVALAFFRCKVGDREVQGSLSDITVYSEWVQGYVRLTANLDVPF